MVTTIMRKKKFMEWMGRQFSDDHILYGKTPVLAMSVCKKKKIYQAIH